MRKTLISLCLMAVVAGAVANPLYRELYVRYANAGGGVDVGTPYAWWKMTGTDTNATQLLDSSVFGLSPASNRPDVATGPILTTSGSDTYYRFDGTNRRFMAQHNDAFNTNQMTVTAWVYLLSAAPSPFYMALSKYDTPINKGVWYVSPQYNSGFGVTQARNKMGFGIGDVQDGVPNSMFCSGTTTIIITNWYHMAWVWDGGFDTNSMNVYLNGNLDTGYRSETGSFVGFSNQTYRVWIGGRPDTWTTSAFNGYLDDVRYFTTALSATQISNIYTEGRK